jgi:hypothetical protein
MIIHKLTNNNKEKETFVDYEVIIKQQNEINNGKMDKKVNWTKKKKKKKTYWTKKLIIF